MQYARPRDHRGGEEEGRRRWEQGGKNKGPAWEAARCADNALCDGWICDKALAAMRDAAAKKDQPFFLAVGFEEAAPAVRRAAEILRPLPPIDQITLPPDMTAPKGCAADGADQLGGDAPYTGIPKKGR
jgi:hypothetical protein